MALIDQWLDEFHYSERHSIEIQAERGDVYRALTEIDLGDSQWIRLLFSLCGIPAPQPALPMGDFLGRFTPLASNPPEDLLVGAIGRFWLPRGGVLPVEATAFRDFVEPGVAKLALTFFTQRLGSTRTGLVTETRVWCTDRRARRVFRWYWYLIRPASGLVRREMLRLTKQRAELGLF